MLDVDKQFWGEHKNPFEPTNQALFLQVMCCPQGFAERCGGVSRAVRRPDWALRFPSSGWTVSQGWSGGTSPFSDWDLEGGRVCLSDLQLLKVPGPMPSPHPASLPSD